MTTSSSAVVKLDRVSKLFSGCRQGDGLSFLAGAPAAHKEALVSIAT